MREEPVTDLRPRRPWEAVPDFKCPSIILLYGADETVSQRPVQELLWAALMDNGQRLEWHYFAMVGHGFIDPDAFYDPHVGELAWPLVVDFLERELENYGG